MKLYPLRKKTKELSSTRYINYAITPQSICIRKKNGRASGEFKTKHHHSFNNIIQSVAEKKKAEPPAGSKQRQSHSSNNITQPHEKRKRQSLWRVQIKDAAAPSIISFNPLYLMKRHSIRQPQSNGRTTPRTTSFKTHQK